MNTRMFFLAVAMLLPVILPAQDGSALYKKTCAGCHDAASARVPPLNALRAMSAPAIVKALETGVMKQQAAGLSADERTAVVAYLAASAGSKTAVPAEKGLCVAGGEQPSAQAAAWTRWGGDVRNTRFQNDASAGIAAADVPKLKLKWAFGLGDGVAVHSQPAISEGRAFVANLTGSVYALDARTGCTYWTFAAEKPVRSAVVVGPKAIYFGDVGAVVYAVDPATGKQLWKAHVEDHFAALVTGAPQLFRDVLYVPVASYEELMAGSPKYECCTFRGSVVALDAATGRQIWKTYTIADAPQATEKSKAGAQLRGPSGASVWSSPTVDEKLGVIYVGTGDNYSAPFSKTSDAVLAMDAKSGKILWSRQATPADIFNNGCANPEKVNCPETHGEDFDFGQPPILTSLPGGRRALVIGQKSGVVHGLDPDKEGEILWQTRVSAGGLLGGMQWGSAADSDGVYAAVSGLQFTVTADPAAPQGYALGLNPTAGGGLFKLRLSTGEKLWSAMPKGCGDRKHCSPAQSGAVTAINGVVFSGSVDGHLRGYSASTGEVVWDADTVCDYDTTNGGKARGGSLDGPGPVIAGGTLYIESGYGQWGGMPGNVLLAFSVDGK